MVSVTAGIDVVVVGCVYVYVKPMCGQRTEEGSSFVRDFLVPHSFTRVCSCVCVRVASPGGVLRHG